MTGEERMLSAAAVTNVGWIYLICETYASSLVNCSSVLTNMVNQTAENNEHVFVVSHTVDARESRGSGLCHVMKFSNI